MPHMSHPAPSRSARRFHLGLRIASLLASVLALAQPALAQERARDYAQPCIVRSQFARLVQDIGLDYNQRQIATIVFDDYESSMEELTRRLDEQAIKAGRATVDDSLSGKARIAADELKRLRAAVQAVYLQAGPEVDSALDMLTGGLEALLTPEQLPKFNDAMRALRREIMLHPRASAASYQEYAGDGVDVLELFEAARAEGGELAGIDPEALEPILTAYEHSLDDVLLATYAADRQGRIARKIASINKDTDALRAEEQAALKRWQRLYQLNKSTVDQIADYASQAVGEDAGAAFAQRFDRESFAWLYPRCKPDRQIEWLRQQQNLPAETLAKAEAVYAQYIAKRDGLSRSAIDMMLRARLELQTILYAMLDRASIAQGEPQSLYDSLVKNTGEQSHLQTSTSSQIEALLDDATRQALRDAMKRPDRPARPAAAPR
jgi:hypothetical protein